MIGRAKTALGIDLSQNRVSLALVARGADGFKLIRGASMSMAETAPGTGALGNVESLSKVLKKLRRHCRIPRMGAAVSMSFSPLVMQMLDLPEQMPTNVGEYIRNELRQYVALSGRNIISDFCGTVGAGGGPKRLLAVGTDREKVRALVDVCGAAGLTVEAVEPAVLGYARAVRHGGIDSARAEKTLIVEINPHHLAACLLRKDVLDSVRVKSLPPEAEAPASTCQWLIDEIKAMVRYYNLGSCHGAVEWNARVVVRGATPIAQEAAELLKTEADIGCLVSVETSVEVGSEALVGRARADGVSPVAFGLALKQLDPGRDPWKVNLLPEEVTQERSFVQDTVRITGMAALLILGLVLSGQLITRTAGQVHQDIERRKVRERLDTTADLIDEEGALDREIAKTERHIRQMTEALAGYPSVAWSSVLDTIRDVMPAETCITRLSIADARTLSLRGHASSYGAAQAFVQRLERLECFDSVFLTKLQRHEGSAFLVYDVECLLKTTQ